jgi:hypothetical protein
VFLQIPKRFLLPLQLPHFIWAYLM